MENKINLQHNKIIHLEDSMVIYSIYNLETLEKLIDTIHQMHNTTTPNENLFASILSSWYVCKCDKNSLERLFTHFSFTAIKIQRNFRRS